MADHHLASNPETVHWGYFDATLPPILTIDSGDSVTISTVSAAPGQLPPPSAGLNVPAALPAIHEKVTRRIIPGHI